MFARLGRVCHDHRRVLLAGWLVLFAVGIALGGTVTDRLGGGDRGSGRLESVQGSWALGETARYGPAISAVVDGVPADGAAVRAALTAARRDLTAEDGVARVVDPTTVPAAPLVATDGRAVLVTVDLERDLGDREGPVEAAVEERLRAIAADVPGGTVTVGGNALLRREVNAQTSRDTTLGEAVALPATLVVMVFLFGGLLAAGVPFLGALASISGGLLSLLGFSTFLDLDPSVLSVTTVLGLGLSIDYALLLVSRFREEYAAGGTAGGAAEAGGAADSAARTDERARVREAVARTTATAGRTITFSALTVGTSLAGLFVFPSPIFRAIASAGVGVVLVALLVGLTLTPALLSVAGRRVGVVRRPRWLPARRRAPATGDDGPFARLARVTRRRPALIAVTLAAVLLAAGLPFLGVRFTDSGAALLPRSFESRRFADLVAGRFPGRDAAPVTVVANTDARTLQVWAASLADEPGVGTVGRAEQRVPGLSSVDVVPVSDPDDPADEAGQDLVRRLRADRPPFATWVTGNAAFLVDFRGEIASRAPWALALVALATFVLLFAMTGSLLVPVKALVMNVLSLGASFGALVLIFQDGWLAGPLGFDPVGGLETYVPVLVFAFAFGLSMDYEVFLLARIKELRDAGLSNDRAVEVGLQRSGKIITSAALLVVIVFAGFAVGKMLAIKELGIAMAIAVAVDATLVRCLLVPATMTLLGEANWWAPGPLRRLHDRFGLREAVAAPPPSPAPDLPEPVAAPGR